MSTLYYNTLAKLAGKAKVMIGSSRGEERGYDSLQSRLNVVLSDLLATQDAQEKDWVIIDECASFTQLRAPVGI